MTVQRCKGIAGSGTLSMKLLRFPVPVFTLSNAGIYGLSFVEVYPDAQNSRALPI
jgi:hypothetical protein